MELAYKTLVIRRGIGEVPPEQLRRFIEVQEAFRRWVAEWYRSNFEAPAPEPLRQFAEKLKSTLTIMPRNVEKMPLPLDVRLAGEEAERNGIGRGRAGEEVLIDLLKGEVEVGGWGGAITVKLKESEKRWIERRVKEGGRPVLARAWVGGAREATFNIALVFMKEAEPIEVRRILAAYLDEDGVQIAAAEGGRLLWRSALRPDLAKIGRLRKEISRLDSLCVERGGRYCKQLAAARSRLRRLLRHFEDEAARKIARLALQYKAAVLVDAQRRENAEKIVDVGRLAERIRQAAEWHGVPYRKARLSAICPRCEAKMEELPGRRARCPSCGLEAPRSEVLAMWATKLSTQPSFFDSNVRPSNVE